MPLPAQRVLARVRAAADPRATVELYGSSVYAAAHAGDVDVFVENDDAARLANVLGLEHLPTTPPRLHGVLEDTPVDITVVNGNDDIARRARSGPRDAALLAAFVRERDDAFQAAWPHVRHFVRARALGHNGLGWFGSFGWALLLAIPLVTDRELRAAPAGAVIPAWLRWLSRLSVGTRISFEGVRADTEPLFLVAPSPPVRDVARISKRTALALIAEARAAVAAITDGATDAAIARIGDLADSPPAGTTLVISGDDEHSRGRYDGTARGLLRELEPLGAIRSWGRFDRTADGWQHRITVPAHKAIGARDIIETWLGQASIDASLE